MHKAVQGLHASLFKRLFCAAFVYLTSGVASDWQKTKARQAVMSRHVTHCYINHQHRLRPSQWSVLFFSFFFLQTDALEVAAHITAAATQISHIPTHSTPPPLFPPMQYAFLFSNCSFVKRLAPALQPGLILSLLISIVGQQWLKMNTADKACACLTGLGCLNSNNRVEPNNRKDCTCPKNTWWGFGWWCDAAVFSSSTHLLQVSRVSQGNVQIAHPALEWFNIQFSYKRRQTNIFLKLCYITLI